MPPARRKKQPANKKEQAPPSTPLTRALSQRLFYISHVPNPPQHSFFVTGNSGKLYTIQLPIVKCNCPDFIFRRRPCKHLLFLLYRVFKLPVPTDVPTVEELREQMSCLPSIMNKLSGTRAEDDAFAPAEVISAVRNAVPSMFGSNSKAPVRSGEGDECPICMESLAEEDVGHCASCGNGVHTDCMERYKNSMRGHVNCILCRGEWEQSALNVGNRGFLRGGRLINLNTMVQGVFEPERPSARSRAPEVDDVDWQMLDYEEEGEEEEEEEWAPSAPARTRGKTRSSQTRVKGRITKGAKTGKRNAPPRGRASRVAPAPSKAELQKTSREQRARRRSTLRESVA